MGRQGSRTQLAAKETKHKDPPTSHMVSECFSPSPFSLPPMAVRSPAVWWCSGGVRPFSSFHLLQNTVLFSPVGFKGNLSLLDIFHVFPENLSKWAGSRFARGSKPLIQGKLRHAARGHQLLAEALEGEAAQRRQEGGAREWVATRAADGPRAMWVGPFFVFFPKQQSIGVLT